MLQHREVEKQGRSRLHERKHRIFTLYLLDFVICHVFIGRSVSLSAQSSGIIPRDQARVWWPTGGGCGCWSTRCVWAPCTGQPTFCGRGSAWPSPPPSTRGIIRCRHSRGYLYTRVLQCARVAASCGAGTACHTLARHVYSLVWAWADITLWKGGAVSRVTCHQCHVCRAVGRLRSLRGLGRGSVRGHAGGGAAAALRHAHSALSLRGSGTQPRYYLHQTLPCSRSV